MIYNKATLRFYPPDRAKVQRRTSSLDATQTILLDYEHEFNHEHCKYIYICEPYP